MVDDTNVFLKESEASFLDQAESLHLPKAEETKPILPLISEKDPGTTDPKNVNFPDNLAALPLVFQM